MRISRLNHLQEGSGCGLSTCTSEAGKDFEVKEFDLDRRMEQVDAIRGGYVGWFICLCNLNAYKK